MTSVAHGLHLGPRLGHDRLDLRLPLRRQVELIKEPVDATAGTPRTVGRRRQLDRAS